MLVTSRTILGILSFVLLPGVVAGAGTEFHGAKRQTPKSSAPPPAAIGSGLEGWAQVCVTVKPDGTTAEPRVVDRSPNDAFARAGVEAAGRWTFEPARLNGEAVEEHDVCELELFSLPPDTVVDTGRTTERLDEAERLVDTVETKEGEVSEEGKAELESATTILDAVVRDGPLTLAQASRLQLLRYRIAAKKGDEGVAFKALEKATVGGARFLPQETVVPALAAKFTGLVRRGRYAEALELFDRFEEMQGGAMPMVVHGKTAAKIREFAGGEGSFAVPATLEPAGTAEGGVWRHRPLRRELGVRGLKGELTALVIACERRKMRLDYQPEVSWKIPPSWGACSVYAEGKIGATFELVEFSPETSMPASEGETQP